MSLSGLRAKSILFTTDLVLQLVEMPNNLNIYIKVIPSLIRLSLCTQEIQQTEPAK